LEKGGRESKEGRKRRRRAKRREKWTEKNKREPIRLSEKGYNWYSTLLMNDMDQEVLLLTTSIYPPSATTCGEVLVGERALHPHEVILNALVLFSSPGGNSQPCPCLQSESRRPIQ